jgi:hypothetical protein
MSKMSHFKLLLDWLGQDDPHKVPAFETLNYGYTKEEINKDLLSLISSHFKAKPDLKTILTNVLRDIKEGSEDSSEESLEALAKYHQENPFDVNIPLKFGVDLLAYAISLNNVTLAKKFIELGAEVNKKASHSRLSFAVIADASEAMIDLLLDNGAELTGGIRGFTPAILGTALKKVSFVSKLLDKFPDIVNHEPEKALNLYNIASIYCTALLPKIEATEGFEKPDISEIISLLYRHATSTVVTMPVSTDTMFAKLCIFSVLKDYDSSGAFFTDETLDIVDYPKNKAEKILIFTLLMKNFNQSYRNRKDNKELIREYFSAIFDYILSIDFLKGNEKAITEIYSYSAQDGILNDESNYKVFIDFLAKDKNVSGDHLISLLAKAKYFYQNGKDIGISDLELVEQFKIISKEKILDDKVIKRFAKAVELLKVYLASEELKAICELDKELEEFPQRVKDYYELKENFNEFNTARGCLDLALNKYAQSKKKDKPGYKEAVIKELQKLDKIYKKFLDYDYDTVEVRFYKKEITKEIVQLSDKITAKMSDINFGSLTPSIKLLLDEHAVYLKEQEEEKLAIQERVAKTLKDASDSHINPITFSKEGLELFANLYSHGGEGTRLCDDFKEATGYKSVSRSSRSKYNIKLNNLLTSHEGEELISSLEYAKSKGVNGHIMVHFMLHMGDEYAELLEEMKIPTDGGSVMGGDSVTTYKSTMSAGTGATSGSEDDRKGDFEGFGDLLEDILEGDDEDDEDDEDDSEGSKEDIEGGNVAAAAASSNYIKSAASVEFPEVNSDILKILQDIVDGSSTISINDLKKVSDKFHDMFEYQSTTSGFTILNKLDGTSCGGHRPHGKKQGVDLGGIADFKKLLDEAGIFEKYDIVRSVKTPEKVQVEPYVSYEQILEVFANHPERFTTDPGSDSSIKVKDEMTGVERVISSKDYTQGIEMLECSGDKALTEEYSALSCLDNLGDHEMLGAAADYPAVE